MVEFFKPKVQPGWVVTIAGLTGSGKTHASNFFDDPAKTFFIDTHGTFSTIETLTILGQSKVWRATEWTDLMAAAKEFIRINKGIKATLVLDTASELVTQAQNYIKMRDNKKGIVNYDWGQVWKEIMAFLKLIVEAGHDLILTLQLKRQYDEAMDDRGQKVSIWNGSFEAKQWKDLPYQCTCQIQLEHGLTMPGQKSAILTNRVFTRLVKSRYAPVQFTKPFIVGAITRENIAPQLLPYSGSFQDCCWEMLAQPGVDQEFIKQIKKVAGSPPEGWRAPDQAPEQQAEEMPKAKQEKGKKLPKEEAIKAIKEEADDEWG